MTGKHAGLRTRYTARQRAELRGWVFRPLNPMPELIARARQHRIFARRMAWNQLRAARVAQMDHYPGAPVDPEMREAVYRQQSGGPLRTLTPRQCRRIRHKNHRAGHPVLHTD